jgi:hypothetical protein
MTRNAQFHLRDDRPDNWPLAGRVALIFGLSVALWLGLTVGAIGTHL